MNIKELAERVDKMEDRQTNMEQALMNLATKQDIKSTVRWPLGLNALLLVTWLVSAVFAQCDGKPLPPLPVPTAAAHQSH